MLLVSCIATSQANLTCIVSSDEVASYKVASDKVASDTVAIDEVVGDEVASDKLASEEENKEVPELANVVKLVSNCTQIIVTVGFLDNELLYLVLCSFTYSLHLTV